MRLRLTDEAIPFTDPKIEDRGVRGGAEDCEESLEVGESGELVEMGERREEDRVERVGRVVFGELQAVLTELSHC